VGGAKQGQGRKKRVMAVGGARGRSKAAEYEKEGRGKGRE
jgi:hypothetical protein